MFRLESRLAWTEFRAMRALVFLLIMNLALGLSGYLILSTFQDALKDSLRANAKANLSGDVAISVRRQLTAKELEILGRHVPEGATSSRLYEFFSMVAAGPDSRLVQIKAIDESYPPYGEIRLKDGGVITGASAKTIVNEPKIWVYPELLLQLNLKVGDKLELGGTSFEIADVVEEDSSQTFRLASLAPKVYAGRSQIEKTTLIQFGTTMTDAVLIKYPESAMPTPEQLKEREKKFLDEVNEPAVRWSSYLEASEDTGRAMGFLFDYLGLGALVGVSLAGFGLAALVRSWLNQKVKAYAVYNALGLRSSNIRRIFLMQLLLLSVATTAVAMAAVGLGLPVLGALLKEFISVDVNVTLQLRTVVKGFFLIALGSIGVTLPFIRQLQDVPTQRLFSEASTWVGDFRPIYALLWAPVLAGFWYLSIREANSYILGSSFFGALIGSYLILAFAGWALFRAVGKLRGPWWARQGFLYLARKPVLLTTFVALSLGTLLTTLIPQIRAGLYDELIGDRSASRPSIFLFDIQDEQIDGVKKIVNEEGHELNNISPLIRSRVLEVNGKPYERKEAAEGFVTREEEAENRFRNRGVNLSSRPRLTAAEAITEGREFSPTLREGKPIELSVEGRYAGRMGFKIGDVIKFDIQGFEIEGEIVNLRRVMWNSFQPNFFILVQPGALDDAPKIWLADVTGANEDAKNKIQTRVARAFPNVSAIDVERAIEKGLEVLDKMVFALQLMSTLTWISGLFVLLSILYRQLQVQEWDATLFRLLGAPTPGVLRLFQVEFGILVLAATFFGSLLAIAIGIGLSYQFFEGNFRIDFMSLALTLGASCVLSLILTSFFSLKLARSNPARVLESVRL
ncbi:MAG: hypothetical protein KF767_02885 [Bdellovibrionaceae bacterium]|nr:hypothetical protein [Pseudobdellovibrionaceae bacterium]